MRVLLTASRTWPRASSIDRALSTLFGLLPAGEVFTLVHGGATGGDTFGDRWAQRQVGWSPGLVEVEQHLITPDDWQRLGRAAGPLRNNEMVELGADICLAAIHNHSKGTQGCATAAQRAGIPVWWLTALGAAVFDPPPIPLFRCNAIRTR